MQAEPVLEHYLKDGETALECIVRNRKDVVQAMKMYAGLLKITEAAQNLLDIQQALWDTVEYSEYRILRLKRDTACIELDKALKEK